LTYACAWRHVKCTTKNKYSTATYTASVCNNDNRKWRSDFCDTCEDVLSIFG